MTHNKVLTKKSYRTLFASVLLAFFMLNALCARADVRPAQKPIADASGQVQLPLNQYTELTELIKNSNDADRHAPVGYALGNAKAVVTIRERDSATTAEVNLQVSVKILDDTWQLVPILPPGTAIDSATLSGVPIDLVNSAHGVSWGTKGAGSYTLNIQYKIDARKSEYGYSLALPLPQASAINLSASIPGTGIDATVIPSAGTQVNTASGNTELTATIPSTQGVQIAWRTGIKNGVAISRAQYSGRLNGEASEWTVEYQAELFGEESVSIALLPKSVTLSDIRVDGKPSAIVVEKEFFSTAVKGRGTHKISADFQIAVARPQGPPQIVVPMSEVPVSRIDFTLPGKKEVLVSPLSHVSHKSNEKETTATAFVPMNKSATISWTEAIPDEEKQELRASANLYHAVHAEEGVLNVHATLVYEITRGSTSSIELEVPKGVDINKISAAQGGIADWRLNKGEAAKPDVLTIFLDRELKDNIQIEIFYDRSLGANAQVETLQVPLLSTHNVHRQRGMIALLSSKELTLKPVEEKEVNRVGENQLPAFIRQDIKLTVAHTFKYAEAAPILSVLAAVPEKKQGRFDAVVSTLVSLSDVTLKGSASVELNVKSGSVQELTLDLPPKVNVLSLSAPSLRTYKVMGDEKAQSIEVQFTQDMEGQFRVELSYEFIMEDSKSDTKVPTISVKGAEVEQGKIAVEALSVVEVQAASAKSLSTLDLAELPQDLVLKTTNPILLAYKYVRADPAHELSLKITRHKEIEVQTAAIDRAVYKTLFTRDGLAVTSATFMVRNTGKQFLRVRLPERSRVWSALVNGNPEKPALAEASGDEAKSGEGSQVLIKIINSAQGFPVQLVYETAVSKIGYLGVVSGYLPRPDMVVTNSHWDVYLPDTMRYGNPSTNMDLGAQNRVLSSDVIRNEMKEMGAARGAGEPGPALSLLVPNAGIAFSFDKLYANQSEQDAYFSLPYSEGVLSTGPTLLVGGATLALLFSCACLLGFLTYLTRTLALAVLAIATSTLTLAVGYFGASFGAGIIVLGAAIIGLVIRKRAQAEARE